MAHQENCLLDVTDALGLSWLIIDELERKVEELWFIIEKEEKDGEKSVERIKCWNILLADDDLARLIGNGNLQKGKGILNAMKEVKALDTSSDGQINEGEFKRLCASSVISAAKLKNHVDEVRFRTLLSMNFRSHFPLPKFPHPWRRCGRRLLKTPTARWSDLPAGSISMPTASSQNMLVTVAALQRA